MNIRTFKALVRHAGTTVPEEIEKHIGDLHPSPQEPLLSPAFFKQALECGGLSKERAQRLRGALNQIEADRDLVLLSRVLCLDAHRALIHQRACHFVEPKPECVKGFARQAYPFLLALACLENGLAQLALRGIPQHLYVDTCWQMARRQMKKFEKTGQIAISDYAWDMNFYACAIFMMDRFYFVPFRWEAPQVWRSRKTGQALALWEAGAKVRKDGQLDGVNGIFDPQAFTTTWSENRLRVAAYPVNPMGVVRQIPVTLRKSEWKPVLAEGDMTLALHIPGGEGYEPQRVRHSMQLALDFFDQYFADIPIKGFWSESWLYDPGLSRLLPPDGRIVSVQRQFYNYPAMEGEAMAKLEVFGSADADITHAKLETSLQKKMAQAWRDGVHFHTSGMFVLREDVGKIGARPYVTDRDIADYLQ